jgi:hypothetical protein
MKTQEIKNMGLRLRELKNEISSGMRKGNYMGSKQWELEQKKSEYRHEHIVYSMARGKSYKEIENYTRPGNEPKWHLIESILLNEYGIICENGEIKEAQNA